MMRRAVTILGVRVGIWDESWTGAAGPGPFRPHSTYPFDIPWPCKAP